MTPSVKGFFALCGGVLLAASLSLFLFFYLTFLTITLVLAVGLSLLFEPFLVSWESRGHRRITGIWIIFVSFTVVLLMISLFLPPVLIEKGRIIGDRFPQLLPSLQKEVLALPLVRSFVGPEELHRYLTEGFAWVADRVVAFLPTFFFHLPFLLLFTPVILFFLLRDRRSLERYLLARVPNRYFERARYTLYRLRKTLEGYVKGVLIEAFSTALVAFAFMWVFGVKEAVTLAIVMGFLNLIPYLGPFLAATGGALYVYILGEPFVQSLMVIAAVGFSHLVDNALIAPLVLGHAIKVHPLLVLLLLSFFGHAFGALGLVIALPFTVFFWVLFQELWFTLWGQAVEENPYWQ